MKKLFLSFVLTLIATVVGAQNVAVKWELSNKDNLAAATMQGDAQYTGLLTTAYLQGSGIAKVETLTAPNATEGFVAKPYDPVMASYYVTTKSSLRGTAAVISFGVTPQTGHKFKPTKISFDVCKVGTDGGNFDVTVKPSGGTETELVRGGTPLRNRVDANNANGYSHHEYDVRNFIVDGKMFVAMIYIYNINGVDNENPKSIALRNVTIEGAVDEEITTVGSLISSFTCVNEEEKAVDLLADISKLQDGDGGRCTTVFHQHPKDFKVVCAKAGQTAQVNYSEDEKTATVTISEGGQTVFTFNVGFSVSMRRVKPAAKPLKRGLMALSLSGAGMGTGNLVSWRTRETDPEGVKFKVYRGSATTQTTKLNSGNFITGKTNIADTGGNATSYYKLEVYNADGELLETEVSGKTWANQSLSVPLGDTPKDPDHGASYTPNDASFCDMDGDGEYEIILKWSPSNEKDAASSGTTSSPYFDCVKLDGTRLWRIRLGDNFFTSAHTIQFIAWDLDGDGYGEFMCKTAPGTIDGKGNYVLLGNDTPNMNLLSGRGKQDHGPEYITVFDGQTGEEISTIPYHTDYAKGQSYWGDSNQNRSERYLAALAYLDGYDKNPSPIFARGYYSGAFIGAYDFDGEQLKERWVHRAYSATSGVVEYGNGTKKTLTKTVYGDGAHWIAVADCDGDGKQEIIYGSSCIDDDGTTLYRTGMGHGDALHVSDFITDRPGLEVLMCHEHKPYGIDIRDAKTGEILLRQEESGDTGRGLAAHFDSSQKSAQFLTSARAQMYNMKDGSVNGEKWALGSSGAGINCRVYWDGAPYDEFFDKSIIAHWNPTGKSFDRFKFNNGNYLWGSLNNGSKNNPCVLGDILGDWREEIVTWNGDAATGYNLLINATHYTSNYALPHLMDDPQYRVQVVNQNCCYNQPPHLSYNPAVRLGLIDFTMKGDLAEGTYYMKHEQTGLYLMAGQSWGTRAMLGNAGIDVEVKKVGDYTYSINTNISNGGNSQYLSDAAEPYVDAASVGLTIKKYLKSWTIQGANGYLGIDNDSNVVYKTLRSKWLFLTRDEVIADLKAAAEQAPVDATILISDPNFGRNDLRYPNWQWSADCTNKNNSGDETNYCVESFHSKFTFSQQLKAIPDGYYTLSAQGFYRQDEADGGHAVLFANDAVSPLPSLDSEALSPLPNSMKDASAAFTQGLYNVSPITFQVTGGTATIGVRNTDSLTDWCIWDNFQLTYYGSSVPGAVTIDDITALIADYLTEGTTVRIEDITALIDKYLNQ